MSDSIQAGKLIKDARNSIGYSQMRLSEETGFAKNSIGNWERGLVEPPHFAVMAILKHCRYTKELIKELLDDITHN